MCYVMNIAPLQICPVYIMMPEKWSEASFDTHAQIGLTLSGHVRPHAYAKGLQSFLPIARDHTETNCAEHQKMTSQVGQSPGQQARCLIIACAMVLLMHIVASVKPTL